MTSAADLSALETVLSGEAQKLLHQHSATILAKYGSIKPELENLHDVIGNSIQKINTLLKTARKQFDPLRDRYDFTRKAGLDDLSLFRFINAVGGNLISFIHNSYTRLYQMETCCAVLLPVLHSSENINLQSLVLAEEYGSNLLIATRDEYQDTVISFEKLLGGMYLSTRNEYKKLRKKFLGGNITPEVDDVEEQLMRSFFGMKPPKNDSNGPAVALIDDNCILTQLFLDIAANLPHNYEKILPVLKRGKLTGKTTMTKFLDNGEVEDWAGTMISISNQTYWKYINEPSELTQSILFVVKSFQTAYSGIAPAIYAVVQKADLDHKDEDRRFIIEDPNALVKQYNRINFLSIRPSAEDIAPRTKLDADMAIARGKLFLHLQETLTQLSSMNHNELTTEEYAILRTKEAVELKETMDEILKTDTQKNLHRNIADDNEFYVGKSGQIGSLSSEREPAPKITYDKVIGKSFVTAKDHVEEVVKVASHPQIMRLSAPRGDVKSNLMLIGPYGCHRKGQGILMYDGSIKKVEDVIVGDLLMGPDSTSREVVRLVRGIDKMAEIIPKKGNSWVVNQKHTLSLVKTPSESRFPTEKVEVTVCDYQKWPKYKKNYHSLYRVPVNFESHSSITIDPYFLGVLLGDGHIKKSVGVTTADQEITKEVFVQAAIAGMSVSLDACDDRTPTYNLSAGMRGGLSNSFQNELKELKLLGTTSETKFIPQVYKVAPKEDRLQLLAGILDTDGHLHGSCCYDYVTKSQQLAEDIAFVSRSLGFATYIKSCKKKSQNGTEGLYYRMIIGGDGVENIPTRIPHKIADKRTRKKNVLRVGFTVKDLPEEEFFGFTVNKDNLYLLDDFIVTRNCGKTEMAKAIGGDKRIIGFNVAVADLLTAYMHESVKNIKRMFELAKDMRRGSRDTKPVGILLDEFDRLFTYGEGVHAAYDGSRMTGVLQEMMDGVVGFEGVFLVTMTNVPKAIPEAVLRRFKYIDVVGQLDQEERAQLFKMFLTRGLPIDPSVTQEDYMKWSEVLINAPGDVIGKVADEIHFKFMHEFVLGSPDKVRVIEKTLNKRLRNREATSKDFDYIRKALGAHKTIGNVDITTALESTIKQPQVKMQIEKARQIYKDAAEIMAGLATVGKQGLGFGGNVSKKSDLWNRD